MRRIFRCLLVAILVGVLSVDTASACRLFRRWCAPRVYRPVCVATCPPVFMACPPVCDVCGQAVIVAPETWVDHKPVLADSQEAVDGTPLPSKPVEEKFSAPSANTIESVPVEDFIEQRSIVNKPESEQDALAPIPVPLADETTDATTEPSETSENESLPLFDTPATNREEATDEVKEKGAKEDAQEIGPGPVEDLFEPSGKEQPAPTTDPSPAEPPAAQPEEAEEPDTPESPSLDDLFGEADNPGRLRERGGLESPSMRRWTDNTARFSCEACLMRVTPQSVVLMKRSGKTSAVRLARLSDEDIRFVHQQVVAKRMQLAHRAAAEKLASVWSK